MSGNFINDLVISKPEAQVLSEVQLPKKFKVVLLNDDYTPMDFVVDILKRFFRLDEETATLVMLQIHIQGKGVGGVYTRDIAETKVAQINDFSRQNEHPLLCIMKPNNCRWVMRSSENVK